MSQTYKLRDTASNGTPRDKLDWIAEQYPDLFRNIMAAHDKGQQYSDGTWKWAVVDNERYGATVYQNSIIKKKPTSNPIATAIASSKQGFFSTNEYKQQQSQKSEDIKAAQEERKAQHNELMAAMKALTVEIAALTTALQKKEFEVNSND